jgi:hypothetical protein
MNLFSTMSSDRPQFLTRVHGITESLFHDVGYAITALFFRQAKPIPFPDSFIGRII